MSEIDIHPSARLGEHVAILGDLRLGPGVEVGSNVTFYPKVSVGANTRILPGAVIGRPPIRAGTTNRQIDSGDESVRIGADCVIGANVVLYTDLRVGDNVMIGDLASIREGCALGDESVIGRGVLIMYDSVVGARSRIIDGAIITGAMTIENDVFIGPHVSTINDNNVYLMRFGLLPFRAKGPTVRRFALIGTGATLAAEVEIGMGAIVAPSAVVTKDVPAWTVAAGVPASDLRSVSDSERRSILGVFGLTEDDV